VSSRGGWDIDEYVELQDRAWDLDCAAAARDRARIGDARASDGATRRAEASELRNEAAILLSRYWDPLKCRTPWRIPRMA
jgi:hypothetical protein